MFRVDASGNVWILDTSGNTSWCFQRDRFVYIDNVTDLSTWDGAAGGSSYFQTEANKTYVVDLQAINFSAESGASMGGSWTGVTAVLPLATADTDKMSVKILLANTGAYTGIVTGSTTVQVWPAPSAGVTNYSLTESGTYDGHIQSMIGQEVSGSTVFTVIEDSAPTPDVSLNINGESQTWMLFYNSSVSASPCGYDPNLSN